MHICIQMELVHISKNDIRFTNMLTVFEVTQVSNQQKLFDNLIENADFNSFKIIRTDSGTVT